jgi:hypothetical protein
LLILEDYHRERVGPNSRVTLGDTGCVPSRSVQRQRAVTRNLGIPSLEGTSLASGVVVRGLPLPSPSPAVTPLFDSVVLTDRPTFTWRPVSSAAGYEVRLYRGSLLPGSERHLMWAVRTKNARIAYPMGHKPLRAGSAYVWSINPHPRAKDDFVAYESQFRVSTEQDRKDLARVKALAASKAPAEMLLAALSYHSYGAFDDALPLFERLVGLRPGEPELYAALAGYYRRAGRPEESKMALDRARVLRGRTRPK